jgi:uncharacterized protein YceH (UPF0502 family)
MDKQEIDFVLKFEEVRVLCSLLEKQVTTPEYYPLTLNAPLRLQPEIKS